jgi:hypothetical protein
MESVFVADAAPEENDDVRRQRREVAEDRKAKQRALLDFVTDLKATIPNDEHGRPDVSKLDPTQIELLAERAQEFLSSHGSISLAKHIETIKSKINLAAQKNPTLYDPVNGEIMAEAFDRYISSGFSDADLVLSKKGKGCSRQKKIFAAWLLVTAALAGTLTYLTYDFYTGTGREAGAYLSALIYSLINGANATLPVNGTDIGQNVTADVLKIAFDTAGIPSNSLLNTYGTWLPIVTFWSMMFDRFPFLSKTRFADADKIVLMSDPTDKRRGARLAGKAVLVTIGTVAPCVTYAATAAADGDSFFTAVLVGASNFASFFLGLSKLIDRIMIHFQPAYRKVVWQYLDEQKEHLYKLYKSENPVERAAMQRMIDGITALANQVDKTPMDRAELLGRLFSITSQRTGNETFEFYSSMPIPESVQIMVGFLVLISVAGVYGFVGATYLGVVAALTKYGRPALGKALGAISALIAIPGFAGLSWTASESVGYGIYNSLSGGITLADLIPSNVIQFFRKAAKWTLGPVTAASGGTNGYFNGITVDWFFGGVLQAINYMPILFAGIALGLVSAPLTNIFYTLVAIDLLAKFLAKYLPRHVTVPISGWKIPIGAEDEFAQFAQFVEAIESNVVEMLKSDMSDKNYRDFLNYMINLRTTPDAKGNTTPTLAARALVAVLSEKLSDTQKGKLKEQTGIDINLYRQNPEFYPDTRYQYEDKAQEALDKARLDSVKKSARREDPLVAIHGDPKYAPTSDREVDPLEYERPTPNAMEDGTEGSHLLGRGSSRKGKSCWEATASFFCYPCNKRREQNSQVAPEQPSSRNDFDF